MVFKINLEEIMRKNFTYILGAVVLLFTLSILLTSGNVFAKDKDDKGGEQSGDFIGVAGTQEEEGDFEEGELIVKYKGDSEPFRVEKLPPGKLVKDAEIEFESRGDVEYAEPNFIAHTFLVPNDTYYMLQWHFDNSLFGGVHSEAAWDLSTGSGVTVAVVDTGIAYENFKDPKSRKSFYKAPDLSGTCFVAGYDFVNNDTHANDDNSHGTHVAGTVAQTTNNSLGVSGLAFNSCLQPVKVLGSNGSGTYSNVAKGIRFAADNGAKVINLSLGGPSSSQTLLDAVAYAHSKGVTIIAAAGNDGTNVVSYPAAYNDYVIAVGATRFDETLSYYSNFGPSLDIVAPGGDTTVDQNDDGYGDGVLQNTFNPTTKRTNQFGYWFFQGTSQATPHVAGLAALLISKGNATTPANVRTAIESTADDLGAPSRDDTYGWGLINAPAALNWAPVP
jgi:serine protease